jgi:hypothetical protein
LASVSDSRVSELRKSVGHANVQLRESKSATELCWVCCTFWQKVQAIPKMSIDGFGFRDVQVLELNFIRFLYFWSFGFGTLLIPEFKFWRFSIKVQKVNFKFWRFQ